jgi:hypothetical protein
MGIHKIYIADMTSFWVNLFKLDLVHFLSRQLRIMSVCQQINVSASYAKSVEVERTAARLLSDNLGALGLVIKVSSDRPISVLYNGKSLTVAFDSRDYINADAIAHARYSEPTK